jgi:hypothetical protein
MDTTLDDAATAATDAELDSLLVRLLGDTSQKLASVRARLPALSRGQKEELLRRLNAGAAPPQPPPAAQRRLPKITPRPRAAAPAPAVEDWTDEQVDRRLEQLLAGSASPRMEQVRRELPNLNPAQRKKLLARLLAISADGVKRAALSYAQQRSWFMERLAPGTGTQNIAAAVKAEGHLDMGLLERCFNEVISRHEVLRTNFISLHGKPVQLIAQSRRIAVEERDLTGVPAAEREGAAMDAALKEAYRPFDLAADSLIRVTSFRLGADERLLLLVMHHIVADEWSIGLLLEELGVLYARGGDPGALPPLPVQYADFAEWQTEELGPEVLRGQLEYWKQRLAGAPLQFEVPTDKPRPPVQTSNGAMEVLLLPRSVRRGMLSLAREENATLFMAMFAAFNVLLHGLTGREDILVGTDFANRNRPETTKCIGFFINELVLRTDLSGDPSFRELLRRVRKTSLECYANQDLPFQWLVEELRPPRDRSRPPIFQVVFDLHNVAMVLELGGLRFRPVRLPVRPAKYDLTLFVNESSTDLHAMLEYNTDLYERATARRLLRDYQQLLHEIVIDPDAPVAELVRKSCVRGADGVLA